MVPILWSNVDICFSKLEHLRAMATGLLGSLVDRVLDESVLYFLCQSDQAEMGRGSGRNGGIHERRRGEQSRETEKEGREKSRETKKEGREKS